MQNNLKGEKRFFKIVPFGWHAKRIDPTVLDVPAAFQVALRTLCL